MPYAYNASFGVALEERHKNSFSQVLLFPCLPEGSEGSQTKEET